MKIKFDTVNLYEKNLKTIDLLRSVGDNFGNCLFQYSVKNLFFDLEHNQFDQEGFLIRCEANLINNNFLKNIDELFSYLKNKEKMLFLSIGQQSKLNENIKYDNKIESLMRFISQKSTNILTRGRITTNILKNMGIENVISAGCPSLMIYPCNDLGNKIKNKLRKVKKIAFGIQDINSLYSKHIIKLCKKYNGTIILQENLPILELSRDHKSSRYINYVYNNKYKDVFDTLADFENFIKNNTIFFNVIPEWLEYLSKFDLYIGLKIHGTIAALMSEIMGICVVHDNRTLELCEQCCIPFILAKNILEHNNIGGIIKNCEFNMYKFDSNRSKIARIYINELEKNNIIPSKHLKNI